MSAAASAARAARGPAGGGCGPPLAQPPPGRDAQRILLVAFLVLAAVLLTAAVTAVALARPAREALGFGFGGVPRTLGEAAAIFLNNVRLMAAVGAAALIVQSPRLGPDGSGASLGAGGRLLRAAVDLALLAVVAFNVAVVGMALGAYGGRMLVAMLPHGPIELNAFAVALALYLRARQEPLRAAAALPLAGLALALLALAALVEALFHF